MSKKDAGKNLIEKIGELPVSEYSEIILDAFIDDETLKSIPAVSTILGLVKAVNSAREKRFEKKVSSFLEEARKEVTPELVGRFYAKLEPKEKERFTEEAIENLSRADSEQKARILGGAFARVINGEVSIEVFEHQARITNNVSLIDIHTFMHGYENENLFIDSLGDVLTNHRVLKRNISAERDKSPSGVGESFHIKVKYELTGIGKEYLRTLHKVYRDVISPEKIIK
ncbi:hypothetical protein FA224_30760 [Pseudomonas aeruginosa]|uniref:hypothetical protein n=1 Tax=Pseudomonas aeruginosa TaxID=287 RepID=UPI001E4863A2|nr:hypothetical protein [Pseudomonas aeruginosa]MCD2925707.1 hypothetical protein [Pseudomonas aeruginosa]MCO2588093.1 hypothetical protein [Pseudomonas aeruginosa]MCO2914543.1 hypothetical protein [Pseudomonas aeruginosa]MCO3181245.1 hypothetical protein [Pseudomonas aeruginosa]WCY46461.1 hypothetical protein KK249_25990 [Pseudomonas aeruginosa]